MVCRGVVLEEGSGVVVADGSVGRTLSQSDASKARRDGEVLELHGDYKWGKFWWLVKE